MGSSPRAAAWASSRPAAIWLLGSVAARLLEGRVYVLKLGFPIGQRLVEGVRTFSHPPRHPAFSFSKRPQSLGKASVFRGSKFQFPTMVQMVHKRQPAVCVRAGKPEFVNDLRSGIAKTEKAKANDFLSRWLGAIGKFAQITLNDLEFQFAPRITSIACNAVSISSSECARDMYIFAERWVKIPCARRSRPNADAIWDLCLSSDR